MVDEKAIRTIPGEQGFRTVSTESTYLRTALRMEHLGIPGSEVVTLLANLYNATEHDLRGV